jgi:phage regulator Rha-like protein
MAKKAPTSVLPKIYAVRRQKVVLDAELAKLYGVPTKRLNEAVRRNAARFPEDFCFFLTEDEDEHLKSQIGTSSLSPKEAPFLRSQFATLKTDNRGRHRKYLPRVFTEHGALMAANVLRSEQAVQMSLYLIRAFVSLREQLVSNLSTLRRLSEIDKKLLEHDVVLREVLERLQPLLNPPPAPKKPLIGFHPGNR